MKNINKRNVKPFIIFKDNAAVEVNNKFERLTGYLGNEIIGKSILEMSNILKTVSQINFDNIEDNTNCFIFTKQNEPREVKISCNNTIENEKVYYMCENRNSRLESVLPFVDNIFKDNKKGVAIYSITHRIILKLNNKFLAFSNIEFDNYSNYLGKGWEIAFPHSANEHIKNQSMIVNNGKPYHLKEVKWHDIENKETYWDIDFVPIHIKGKIKYLVQTVVNVTQRIVWRNNIEKQNQELEAIIENISDELVIFDNNGEYLKINKAARDNSMFDYKINKNVVEAYKQVDLLDLKGNKLQLDEIPIKRILKGEKVSNYQHIRKINHTIQYKETSGVPILDNSTGKIIAGVVVMRDISKRLKYEESLHIKAQYDLLKRIIDNLELGIARITVPDYKFIDINNKGYDQFKECYPELCSQNLLVGKSVYEFYDNEIINFSGYINLLNSLNENNVYQRTINYNIFGKEVYHKYIFQPLLGLNNEIIEIIVIGIDITEEENAKTILENTLKMQEELFSNVSHELKTPLNVIFSANQVLDMFINNDLYDKEKFKLYNKSIKQNCYRLIKLINNIVDLSKSNSGYFEIKQYNENIVEIINNIVMSVDEYVKSKDLRIIFETDVKEKIISCDLNLIERVVLNLISNAIKFSETDSDILVSFKDKGSTVEISVKDEGIGISEEHINLLFERFYRIDNTLSRNTEGSGIGLPLIKSIIEQHEGNIKVESKLGQGSTFIVELPAKIADDPTPKRYSKYFDDKIETINIEFSDIYKN